MESSLSDYQRRILDDELDELIIALPAIAIEGAKAIGKTETASQRAATIRQLDDPAQRQVAEADPSNLWDGAEPPVLVDEWQYLPAVWDRIRREVDRDSTAGRFLLTGSSSPDGLGTHSGAGRIARLRMRPLSLAERYPGLQTVSLAGLLSDDRIAIDGRSRVSLADYTDEILRGGFPGLRELTARPLRMQLDGYLARVIDRDFAGGGGQVADPRALGSD